MATAMEDVHVHLARDLKTGMMIDDMSCKMNAGIRVDRSYNYDRLIEALISPDHVAQAAVATRIRISLCGDQPPIQDALDSGMVPILVSLLSDPRTLTPTKLECVWILTNLASGTSSQSRVLVSNGVVPALVKCMEHKDVTVGSQAIWALANLAGDSEHLRDVVIKGEAVRNLIRLSHTVPIASSPDLNSKLYENMAFCIMNLCRWKTSCKNTAHQLICMIPTLFHMVTACTNETALINACTAIATLTDGKHTDSIGDAVIKTGVQHVLVELLAHKNTEVIVWALRAIGNMLADFDWLPESKSGLIPAIRTILSDAKHPKLLWKYACLVASNITARHHRNIQAVIDGNLMQSVLSTFNVVKDDDDDVVRREATWVICNSIHMGTDAQRRYLLRQGTLPLLLNMLARSDVKLVEEILSTLDCLMSESKDDVVTAFTVRDAISRNPPMLSTLVAVTRHPSAPIAAKATRLLASFYAGR